MAETARRTAALIRQAIRNHKGISGTRRAWPADIRQTVVRYATEPGMSVYRASRELDISYPTIKGWVAANRKASEQFVVAKQFCESATATVVAPNGIRVEGLTLRNVAELLKHLEP